jgi:alpha-D-xyloside xylohydrolase
VIPHMGVAQSTSRLDWSKLEAVVFSTASAKAHGLVYVPGDDAPATVAVERRGNAFTIVDDPLRGKATWSVRRANAQR